MDYDQRNETDVSTNQTERIGDNVSGVASAQSPNAAPPVTTPDFAERARRRKE